MKKKVLLIIVIVLCAVMLCACGVLKGGCSKKETDRQIAHRRLEQLLKAIESKDKAAIKAMFSKNAIAQDPDFDDNLEYLLQYYEGNFDSYYDWGLGSGGKFDYGERTKYLDSSYDVKNSVREYRVCIYDIVIDTVEPDNVGMLFMYIIKREDDISIRGAYLGDGKDTPGINIGIPRNENDYI